MNVKLFTGDIEELRPIAKVWQESIATNDFNIEIVVNVHLIDLHFLAEDRNSDLFVLYDDDGPVGYLGLRYFKSPLSEQIMAEEHYYFVVPDKRGPSSIRLIKDAMNLARLKGCSHIIFNASNLAGEVHDKVCGLYEKMEMKKFETSYIKEL